MRKIIECTLVSVDGVIGDPHLWAMQYFDQAAQDDALSLLSHSDAMLMGRRTYEIFSAVWPTQSGPYADRLNNIRKYVFSSTLQRAEWKNATIIGGDVAAEVAKLGFDGHVRIQGSCRPTRKELLESCRFLTILFDIPSRENKI